MLHLTANNIHIDCDTAQEAASLVQILAGHPIPPAPAQQTVKTKSTASATSAPASKQNANQNWQDSFKNSVCTVASARKLKRGITKQQAIAAVKMHARKHRPKENLKLSALEVFHAHALLKHNVSLERIRTALGITSNKGTKFLKDLKAGTTYAGAKQHFDATWAKA